MSGNRGSCPIGCQLRMAAFSLLRPRQTSVLQRLSSSAISRRVHAAWHEAVADAPGRLTASATGVKDAAVVQPGCAPLSPSTRSGMSAVRRVGMVLPTRSGLMLCRNSRQCAPLLEKILMTNTPETMRPMPSMAARSSVCLCTIQPISVMSTMPAPAQIA